MALVATITSSIWSFFTLSTKDEIKRSSFLSLLKDEIVSKDLDQIRNLFDEIEKKSSFVDILETAGKAKGVQIFIGSKNFLFKHSGLSMVMAPYKNNDQEIIGAIGVVGPTRLNYSKIVPLVDYTSKIIGKVID